MPSLPRLLAACLFGLACLPLRADPLAIASTELPSPAEAGSLAPQLATAPDGTVYLCWLAPLDDRETALRFAKLDLAQRHWTEPRTIARGENWTRSGADTPQFAAAGGGRLAAVWSLDNPGSAHEHHASRRALVSFSHDDGLTWSAAAPLSSESNYHEFVSLAALPGGRWLAAWLDGRGKHHGDGAQRLYARVLGGAETPDLLVDERVCDCCATALAAFPDGSALLAYRDRSPDEVRDIRVATFRDGRWSEPRPLNDDGWKIDACPVNGPALHASGARLAVAWFTAAEREPRILASQSPDAGQRFLLPARLDQARPAGRVDTVLLRDGSQWVSWLGQNGAVHLRRVAPSGEASLATTIGGKAKDSRATGTPRLAIAREDDATPAQLVLARTAAGEPSRVTTHLITLPAAKALAANDCACDPDAATASRGHPVKGRIVGVLPDRQSVIAKHEEVPGVMRAMTMEFKVAPELLGTLREGQEFLARMERRADGKWWLFQINLLGAPRTP